MADANIRAVITAKDEASSVLKKFGDGASTIGAGVEKAAKAAALALVAVGGAAVAFGVSSVKAFEDSQDRIAQTNAVLASTKGIAGVTADAVDKLSKALQKQTTYSDEDVRSVENLLLTFTAIKDDIFPQATKAVLNMATALGEDTKSASIQLGKALQDPVLGITALRRVGVNFNDAQKEVIKNLVDTGRSAEAQKLILKELETEFGNSAEAARHTFGGSLKALKNQLNDVQETIGGTITRYLQPFIQKAADALAAIDWDRVIKVTINDIKEFYKELDNLWQRFDKVYQIVEHYLKPGIDSFISHMKNLWKETKNVVSQIGDYLIPKFEKLLKAITDMYEPLKKFVSDYIVPLIKFLGPIAGVGLVWAIGAVVDIAHFLLENIFKPLFTFIDNNKGIVLGLVAVFGTLAFAMALGAAFDAITAGFATLQLITIPSLMATLVTLGQAFWAAFPLAAIAAAAVFAFEQILNAANKTTEAIYNTQNAIDKASNSDDALIRRLQQQSRAPFSAEVQESAKKQLAALAASGAFASGGFTGQGGVNEVAGVVHKGEYVVPQSQVNQSTGQPNMGNVNISINVGTYAGSQMELRKLAQKLMGAYQDAQGMGTI